jgi:hypothetical protein
MQTPFFRTLFFFLNLSPFYIEYPETKNPTYEDFKAIDSLLDQHPFEKNLEKIYEQEKTLRNIHSQSAFIKGLDPVLKRIDIALNMRLTDVEDQELPSKNLIKINRGGKNLVVSCIGFSKRRPKNLLDNLKKGLEDTGFNGYLYYRIGGCPTPRGIELNLCATPYAFKIFLMEEAKQLGFDLVLWLDARLTPLRDIKPLFDFMERHGSLLNLTHTVDDSKIFQISQASIFELTHTRYEKNRALATPVLGLKMSHPGVKNVIDGFYRGCQSGLPFFSCYPEEIFLAALFEKYFPDAGFLNEKAPEIWAKLYLYSHSIKTDQKLAVFSKKKHFFFFGVSNEGVNEISKIIFS